MRKGAFVLAVLIVGGCGGAGTPATIARCDNRGDGHKLSRTEPVCRDRAVAKRWPSADRAVRGLAPRHECGNHEAVREHVCLRSIEWERRRERN